MPVQDAAKVKEKIITFIRLRGPSLPVQIAKETGLSILFASAFLSELYGEKEISLSNLRVGSSPLYFISGQEPQLERFSHYLKSREKEAFLLLKQKKFLRDSELQPAIRVALREIKDFAIPFRKDEEIYWRYFTVPENEFKQEIEIQKPEDKVEEIEIVEIKSEPEKIESEIEKVEERKIENIFDNHQEEIEEDEVSEEEQEEFEDEEEDEICEDKEEPIKKEKPKQSKSKKQNKNKKKDEHFFNKIKECLEKKKIEILDIRDFQNEEAILKIKKEKKEELLFVFNRKRITEKEILKAHKKASEEGIPYSILSLGEPSKKLNDLIEAIKNLSDMGTIE
ncbi:MAG: FaeA/PapI family transcriptional regulator [Candidatus Nanoarchaeia archaeon]|nr:FaeA/PapI family transcriptional regulator [Candidatus Nanoarchaeia archaeon]MDD5358033.1 FaeA/PapI family transcriptional regulator [Candidatus Nanoarchaeia archaeon]MDD5588952.1 FaeA/PapI family transcriptional regulator [Candidatus Nanoarchaeia archaeon]